MQEHSSDTKTKTLTNEEDSRRDLPGARKDGDSEGGESSVPDRSLRTDPGEIDFFDVIFVLWKGRLWIVGTTLASVIVALLYLFAAAPATHLYTVSMEIRPGITGYNIRPVYGSLGYNDGKPAYGIIAYNGAMPIYGWSVGEITSWFGQEYYQPFLNKTAWKNAGMPSVTAVSKQDDKMVSISLRTPDPQAGKKVLQSIFQGWVRSSTKGGKDPQIQQSYQDLDQQIGSLEDKLHSVKQVETKQWEARIAKRQREMKMLEQQIVLEKKYKQITQSTIQKLNQQQDIIKMYAAKLINLRDELIKQNRTEGLSLLLYTDIIQQNLQNAADLRQQIAQLQESDLNGDQNIDSYKKQIQDLNDEIVNLKLQKEDVLSREKKRLQQQISDLQTKKASLAPVELVAPPVAREESVPRRSLRTIALAIFIGLFLGAVLVWFREGWETRKNRRG